MAYWLCVTTRENWRDCLKNDLWGVEPRWENTIKKVRIGDKLIFHVKGTNLGGICTVTREYFYDRTTIWRDGVYPHRINFEPESVGEPLVSGESYREFLNEELRKKPSFRISMQKLSEEQYEKFEELVERES